MAECARWGWTFPAGEAQAALKSLKVVHASHCEDLLMIASRLRDVIPALECGRPGEALLKELDDAIEGERRAKAAGNALAFMAARVFATGLAARRSIDDIIAKVQLGLRNMPPLANFTLKSAIDSFYEGLGELGGFAALAQEGLKRCNQLSPLSRLWFACERLTAGALGELEAARGGAAVSPAFAHFFGDPDTALQHVPRSEGAREISALFIVESAQLAVGDVEVSAMGCARELVLGPFSAFQVVGVQRGAPRAEGGVGRAVVHLREVTQQEGDELAALRAEVAQLRGVAAQLRGELEGAKRAQTAAESATQRERAAKEELKKALTAKDAEVGELKKALAQCRAEAEGAKKALAQRGDEAEAAKAAAAKERAAKEALAAEVAALKGERAAAKAAPKPEPPAPVGVTVVRGVAKGADRGLRAVVISAAVREIAEKGFHEFSKLEEVRFEGSILEKIGDDAFRDCAELKALRLPRSVREIGKGAFFSCTALQSLTLPTALKRIPADMCQGCHSLKEVGFPRVLEEVGDGAFYWCVALVSVRLPQSVRKVGAHAFALCEALTSVEVPKTAEIGEHVYCRCGHWQWCAVAGCRGCEVRRV